MEQSWTMTISEMIMELTRLKELHGEAKVLYKDLDTDWRFGVTPETMKAEEENGQWYIILGPGSYDDDHS